MEKKEIEDQEVKDSQDYIEEALSSLLVAQGLMASKPELKFSYLELLGLQKTIQSAVEELQKAADIHYDKPLKG